MEKKTVFVKTDSGVSEVQGHSSELYGDVKRILLLVDDKSNVGDITRRAPPSLRDTLPEVLKILMEDGYIMDSSASVNAAQKSNLKISSPAFKMSTPKDAATGGPVAAKSQPAKSTNSTSKSDLDFSFINSGGSQGKAEADKVKERALAEAKVFAEAKAKAQAEAEAEAKAKAKAQAKNAAKAKLEADRLKAMQAAQIEAASKAAKIKAYEEAKERARHEVAAKSKLDAEARLKNDAEAARRKAEQEVLNARSELEVTKARVEAEVRSRIEAEVRVKQEVEAANLKAKQEAEKLRLELVAAKAKAEAELKNRLEAEARVKAEVEARIKREAEAERLKLEKERAEQEAARVKAEAEIKIRTEAEMRVRAEVEARLKAEEEDRLKREVEAERMKLERERAEIELARVRAEAELKMRTEAELRIRAEVEARMRAEEIAKNGDRRKASSDTSNGSREAGTPSLEEQHEQAELLKKSFVESFNQSKSKQQKSSLFNFKLDTFSLSGKWKKADPSLVPKGLEDSNAGNDMTMKAQQEAEARRIKSEQEAARIKAEQEEAARIKAEQEAARIKAEQEARRAAEHEAYRLQAEQNERQAKADAEARELAGQQAKQWEEAQRRASAQAERERLDRESAAGQAKSRQKAGRAPRKPIPVGKILLGMFALFLIVVTALPYVWQYDGYIAPLEKEISAQLNQPVRIKKIHFTLLPMPKLELSGLYVGEKQELQIGEAALHFNLSALLSSTKPLNKVVLNKISVSSPSFGQATGWLQSAGGNEKYPVARMELQDVTVTSDEIKLPVFNVQADFDSQGKFVKADVRSDDGKLELEVQSLQKRLQLELKAHESTLPMFPQVRFKDLSVSGVIENGDFTISDIFAHIYGGTLTGKGQLSWINGWKLQGQLLSKSLELQSLFPNFGLTGELFGDVNINMYGQKMEQLGKDVRLEGNFEAKNGVISKLDIDSMARFGSRKVAGSRSNFSQLAGTFKADNRGQRIYLNKMLIGVVSGSGLFEVDANQQLTGKLSVNINAGSGKNVPLLLSGSLKEPQLQAGR